MGCYCSAHGRSKNWFICGTYFQQKSSSPETHDMIAKISLNEEPWLQFTFAHAKPTFCQNANNKRNLWSRTITRLSKNSRNLGQSEGISNYNFMSECGDIDFLPKSGQACSCHLVTHITWSPMRLSVRGFVKKCHLNCFIDKKVCTNYGEVYAENSAGH